MPGPIPIAQKAIRGDTKKRGARKHAEMLAQAWMPERGAPAMPRDLPKYAKQHWRYTVEMLTREGMMALADEGILTALCLAYHEMRTAVTGKPLLDAIMRYASISDRMGLSEKARAMMTKPQTQMDDLDAAMLMGPRRDTA